MLQTGGADKRSHSVQILNETGATVVELRDNHYYSHLYFYFVNISVNRDSNGIYHHKTVRMVQILIVTYRAMHVIPRSGTLAINICDE